MYLFGDSYFDTFIYKEVFQTEFILFVISEVFILLFTSWKSRKNSGKKKVDKGSCILITLGYTSIICLNLFCRKELLLLLPSFLFWIGVMFIVMGVVLRVYSVLTLGKFFTLSVQVNSSQKIIQTGPYKYLRHPAYSGSILFLIGFSLSLRSFIGIIGTLIIIAIVFGYRINIEEKALENNFKTSYLEYKKKTSRVIPFIW